MNSTHLPTMGDNPSRPGLGQTLRRYLTGRRGLIVLAAVALAAGLSLNWGWLVAGGIAPVVISVLPCVAMCALGFCMNKMTSGKCSSEASESIDTQSGTGTTPPALPGGRGSDPSGMQ